MNSNDYIDALIKTAHSKNLNVKLTFLKRAEE